MTHWRKDTKQTSYDLSHQESQCLGRKDQSHSSLKHFVDTYFTLGHVLSGEISDMVFALTDYRLETSWKEQLAMRPHTINYRLTLAIQTYMTQLLMDAKLSKEPLKFGL